MAPVNQPPNEENAETSIWACLKSTLKSRKLAKACIALIRDFQVLRQASSGQDLDRTHARVETALGRLKKWLLGANNMEPKRRTVVICVTGVIRFDLLKFSLESFECS